MIGIRGVMPRRTPYLPIAEYGLIGDTLTAALVARDGSLDWLCLPDVDDPSVFGALLDSERGGRFFVGPAESAESHRAYVGDSAVLRTRHQTAEGVLEVTRPDAAGARRTGRACGHRRRVLRLVEAVEGTPKVAVSISRRVRTTATGSRS